VFDICDYNCIGKIIMIRSSVFITVIMSVIIIIFIVVPKKHIVGAKNDYTEKTVLPKDLKF